MHVKHISNKQPCKETYICLYLKIYINKQKCISAESDQELGVLKYPHNHTNLSPYRYTLICNWRNLYNQTVGYICTNVPTPNKYGTLLPHMRTTPNMILDQCTEDNKLIQNIPLAIDIDWSIIFADPLRRPNHSLAYVVYSAV